MTRHYSPLIGAFALLILGAGGARSQTVSKTWVSSTTGADSGTCQFVSPCKTFAYAITQTAAGGELDVKDAGSYGTVTINKAISIVSKGELAAISVPQGGTGITISAGTQEKVVLDGLVIDGHGTGTSGILLNSAYSVTIENSHVRNVTQTGIGLQPNDGTFFNVVNTEVASVGGIALSVQPAVSRLNGVLSGVFVHDSSTGIDIEGPSSTSIVNSIVSANNYGIQSGSNATILLGETTVADNKTYGIYIPSGQIESYGDNDINANGTDIAGTLSSIARR